LLILGVPGALYGAIAGALGIILTAGRDKPSIVGKLIGGLGSLYGISAYLSDVLSYSRLLALGLSTGVVATVINKMGVMGGPSFFGVFMFILVFIFGNLLNLAINLLGAYVHSSRLQYIEFFNKFFEGGGKLFLPLRYKTKYVDIIKEEI
jgi:V/A-type H+-transporting ATPase subunit I